MKYVNINKNIKNYNKMNLPIGTQLEGLIKNYQKFCVFVQLNIGYVGVVYKSSSVKLIKQKYKLGDIINFHIVHVEHSKRKYVLDINEENNKNGTDTINYLKKSESNTNIFSNKVKLWDKLNISEKSFYPKSYLVNQNKENNNLMTQSNINIHTNTNYNFRLFHNFNNGFNKAQYPLEQKTNIYLNQKNF